jgi:hypothetical protein
MIFSTFLYSKITKLDVSQIFSDYEPSLFEDMIVNGLSYEEAKEIQNEKISNKNNFIILSVITFTSSCFILYTIATSSKNNIDEE